MLRVLYLLKLVFFAGKSFPRAVWFAEEILRGVAISSTEATELSIANKIEMTVNRGR